MPEQPQQNRHVTVFMGPSRRHKATPVLGYVFPCGASRTLIVSPEDATELVRLATREVPDMVTRKPHRPSRFTVELGEETADAPTPKVKPMIGWKPQRLPRPAIDRQADAFREGMADVADALRTFTGKITAK